MGNPTNNFEWAHKLECPPTACTDTIKKTLSKGILELLWSEIGNATFTTKDVKEVRKNILLYKLRHKKKDSIIECIKNIAYLKAERSRLKISSSSLKEQYEQQDFLVRQRVKHLEDIKSKYSLAKDKKALLKIKYNEIRSQLDDSNKMRLICQKLMPQTSEDLDQNILKQSLDTVTTLCFGATKREVKNKILNLLGHVKVSTLWSQLYQTLCQDVENLIKLRTVINIENTDKNNDAENVDANGEDIDVGIARLCGKNIFTVSKKIFFHMKAKECENDIMKYITNIETSTENQNDVSEWLTLILEVKKLEMEEKVVQNEIKVIQSECNNNTSSLELQRLLSEIYTFDTEIDKYVENIQRSLQLLKSAECIISRMKNNIHMECMNFLALRADNSNFEWLNKDLTTELQIFYDVLDIRALKKIILQGEIKSFRHETRCLKEASVLMTNLSVPNVMPYFPMIKAPIYCLIDCYKNLITNSMYQSIIPLIVEDNNSHVFIENDSIKDYNTLQLLISSQHNCNKAQEEIDAFNVALNAWNNQMVQEVMAVVDKTVDDLTFTEWMQRYTLLLYMIDSANNK